MKWPDTIQKPDFQNGARAVLVAQEVNFKRDFCWFLNPSGNGDGGVTRGNAASAKSAPLSPGQLQEHLAEKTKERGAHIPHAYLPSKVCFL